MREDVPGLVAIPGSGYMRVFTALRCEGRNESLHVRLQFSLTPHSGLLALSFRNLTTIEYKEYVALDMCEFHLGARHCSGSSGSLGFEFRRLLDLRAGHSDGGTVKT